LTLNGDAGLLQGPLRGIHGLVIEEQVDSPPAHGGNAASPQDIDLGLAQRLAKHRQLPRPVFHYDREILRLRNPSSEWERKLTGLPCTVPHYGKKAVRIT